MIDDELIHDKDEHEHFKPQPKADIQYEPFIQPAEEEDTNPVKVDPVSAPTYEEIKPYAYSREATVYHADELPDFGFAYKPLPKPAPVHHAPGPAPTGHALKHADDDIWGGYRAKYAGPGPAPRAATPVHAEPWQPQPYQAFDVSKYLLKSRGALEHAGKDHHDKDHGYPAGPISGGYWWETQPAAGPKPGVAVPWWDELTADLPAGGGGHGAAPAQHYKPAYTPYVPRSARPTPGAPRVRYEARPLQKYWWQK